MIRSTYVMRNGRLVQKRGDGVRSNRVHVISDDLGADLEHMAYADGRKTASKSVFRRWTKDAGCVEKGNDRERPGRPLADVRNDVGRAIQMLREGYRPQLRRIEGIDG